MSNREMPKAYEPGQYEDAIYSAWEKSGLFNPDNLPGKRKEAFSIVLPPPNVTGTLHLGHAVMLAIEDIMTRFARLQGKKALWIPGTDHAAIATQSKVEKELMKKGMKDPRRELGREAFLKEVEAFAQASHDTIVGQTKKMGASVDWSREAYTLDAARNKAVNTVFKMMYDDGLIYRAHRVVNWDPLGRTVISDDEIVYKETTAPLYTFRYWKDFPIAISTTRPETKVGDTAVAVHPDDTRYAEFIGKTFDGEFCGVKLSIKVVADPSVDLNFGTGALGVTPAHSQVDAEIAGRHQLPMIQVIGEDGRMLPAAGKLAGQTTLEARAQVVEWLRDQKLVEKEEDVAQNLSTAERSGGAIEPLPKLQWFVSVNKEFKQGLKKTTLKRLMQEAVRNGGVKIVPERFDKTYFHWIDNLRDWCISRQIWFGHRIPVWYRPLMGPRKVDGTHEVYVGVEAPEGEGWEQDSDTLDTWFSAGIWTFSTLGWPDKTADLKTFHPTTVLETGYDILFFWVARMILMTTYVMREVPFKTVYLHGLVRDEQGRKMSKSLGNIIDPLDMISKYGADATRLALVIGSTPGNDQKLSEEKIAGYRNFTNKLWNISRFVLTSVSEVKRVEKVKPATLADKWILSRLSGVSAAVTRHLEAHEFSAAGEALREFTWNDFADWYLEIAKIEKGKDEILLYVLERLLTLWHPFMPFVTEEVWKQFGTNSFLMVEEWPEAGKAKDEKVEKEFTKLQEVIVDIRNLRSTNKIAPTEQLGVEVLDKKIAKAYSSVIYALSRTREVDPAMDKKSVSSTNVVVYLPSVDAGKERVRLTEELEQTRAYVVSLDGKLGNVEFTSKAPGKVVDGMRAKKSEAEAKAAELEKQLKSLA